MKYANNDRVSYSVKRYKSLIALMFPFVLVGAVGFMGGVACSLLFRGPTKENETVKEAKERLEREERQAAEDKENERRAKELEEAQKKLQDMETERKQRETDIQAVERKVKDEEESRRQKEEDERIAREKNEEERRELERRIQELQRKDEEHKETLEKRKKEQEAYLAAERAYGPLRWPTREEFQETLRRTQYDISRFHFAIVGRAGCGKSSLINAFRNLRNRGKGAAPTGTTETTLEIGRYPDPGTEPPRQWMVWFDVPGAGTQRIPYQDYFLKQGLYVFDLIVLAIGDRFEEIDVRIIEDCARFGVPVFIVQSKADMHILNMMQEYEDCERITDNPELYCKCVNTFMQETQDTVSDGLARQNLPDQGVYIVSRDVLRRTYHSALQRHTSPDWSKPDPVVLHERLLVNDLLAAAAARRCERNLGSMAQVCRTTLATAHR
jgi:GTP-binding protein EngB required for normal cell division